MKYTKILRRKLFLLQSVVLILFGIVVVFGVSVIIYQHMIEDIENEFATGVISKAEAVSQWLVRAEDVARQITSRSRIRQELEKYNHGEIHLAQLVEFTRPKLSDAIRSSSEVEGITRLDAKGTVITSLGLPPPQASLNVSIPLNNDLTNGYLFKYDDTVFFWVRAPIINRKDEAVGADIVVLSTKRLAYALKPGMSTASLHNIWGFLLISVKEHNVVFKSMQGSKPISNDLINKCLANEELASRMDSVGASHLDNHFCVSAPVKGSNWKVVSWLDREQLVVPIFYELIKLLPLVIALYAICLLAYWIALRPLAERILLKHSELQAEIEAKTDALHKELLARKKAEQDKDAVIVDLKKALQEVKTLGGLLPICANCKKIRDDKGYWLQVEEYIKSHADVEFTHGICPECQHQLYPEIFKKK